MVKRFQHGILAAAVAAALGGGLLTSIIDAQTRPAPAASQPKKDDTPPGEAADAPKRPNPNEAGGMMDRAADSGAQVYVDDSFASVEKLRTAQRYASQGQSALAIRTFQSIIDDYGQKLVYLNNDSYISITDYVRERLLNVAAVRNGMYDELYGQQAARDIDAASSASDLPTLVRVCDRYFPSTAALKGLTKAGDWYFERGEFSSASRTWQKLLVHPAVGDHQAELLFRATLAEHLAGNDDSAKKLAERLTKAFPDATATIDGQEVTLADQVDTIMKLPAVAAQAAAPGEWPAFDGGPARTALAPGDAMAGARLWGIALDDPAIAGDKSPGSRDRNVQVQQLVANRNGQEINTGPFLSSYPTLSHGMLFFNTGERVIALSANAGTPQWSYPTQVISRMNQQQEMMMRQGNGAARPAAHDSATILGDEVFAVLPANPVAGAQIDNPYGMMQGFTRLVCLDRDTGKEKWSSIAQKVTVDNASAATPPPGEGVTIRGGIRSMPNAASRGSLTFIGSPIVTRQGVYVMANRANDPSFLQYFLVRLDRDTGAPTWSCYLCSATTGAYYSGYVNSGVVPIPSLVDDVIYISTGQGADCAVDANIGRILWLQVTDAAKSRKNASDYYVQQAGTASWKYNAPLATGDKLVTFETAGIGAAASAWLRVYDRWSGKILASATKAQLHVGAMDILAGISDNKAILTGQGVAAIDLASVDKNPAAAWTVPYPSTSEAGRPAGRPFMTESRVYVPFDKGMFTVDTKLGKAGEFWPWPKTEKDVPGKGGNMLVTNEQVVVLNDQEIAGYSRWETARDNRLADIKSHPNAPEPYLGLAEISFRTAHYDLAEENMRKSVELANAGAPGASGSAADNAAILDRLYRTNLNFAVQLLGKPDDALRARSRFYYEQCKIVARGPEQQAEWRLAMSELSIKESKPDEAARLYNEVLVDPALRAAPFHKDEAVGRAGVDAEMRFRTLLEKNGVALYAPFEQAAAAALAKAGADPVALSTVIDNYPNSAAAITAATRTAAAAQAKGDYDIQRKALTWLYPRVTGPEKGTVTAQLAAANLALKKYGAASGWAERGLRQFKDFTWTDAGQSSTFAALRQKIRDAAALAPDARLAILPPPLPDANGRPVGPPDFEEMKPDAKGASSPLATGTLLCPVETAPAFNRPDLLFVYQSQKVRVFSTHTGKELTDPAKPIALPISGATAALLGCVGDTAIFAQNRAIVAVNLKTFDTVWKQSFTQFSVRDAAPAGNIEARQRAAAMARANGGLVEIDGDSVQGTTSVDLTGDPESVRQTAIAQLNRPYYSAPRLVGNKLLLTTGSQLRAFDVTTGKPAWLDSDGKEITPRIPDVGSVSVISATDDLVTVQIDRLDRVGTTYVVVDADTGKLRRQISLNDEHAYWRALSDDNLLFVVSNAAVEAFDLNSDSDKPLWRRSDIQCHYPAATQLSLDGLIVVNASNEVVCLSPDGGEARWPAPSSLPVRLNIPSGQNPNGQLSFLRSILEGDMVIYESAQGISAYYTDLRSPDDGQLAWEATFTAAQTPPLINMDISDPYLVAVASGPVGTNSRSMDLIFINRKGGKRHLDKRIQRSGEADAEAPNVLAWQLVDNGLALEVSNAVFFYHGKFSPQN